MRTTRRAVGTSVTLLRAEGFVVSLEAEGVSMAESFRFVNLLFVSIASFCSGALRIAFEPQKVVFAKGSILWQLLSDVMTR